MIADNRLQSETGSQPAYESYRVLFFRGLALFFLWSAVQYWMHVVGYAQGPNSQFDLMSEPWRIASATLSVLLPIVALGLWGLFSWGIAVWFLAIAIELAMYLGFPELYGTRPFLLIFHAVTGSLFLIFYFLTRNSDNKN